MYDINCLLDQVTQDITTSQHGSTFVYIPTFGLICEIEWNQIFVALTSIADEETNSIYGQLSFYSYNE